MTGLAHKPFDVLFSSSGDGYRALLVRSPAGDGQTVSFACPVTQDELIEFTNEMSRFKAATAHVAAAQSPVAKHLGGQLFDVVFADAIGEGLQRSLDQVRDHASLRIQLRLSDCPELAMLPWELLFDRTKNSFLALSDRSPVVRYVHQPYRARPVRVTERLRILVIKSEPSDRQPLDLAREWAYVAAALEDLIRAEVLAFTELDNPTLGQVRQALVREDFHVLHYIGHGGFDPELGGVLEFCGRSGRSEPVTAEKLGVLLHDHTRMRLAVLNTCEAGRTEPANPFAGVADTLVRSGIPAVIAMQQDITDRAAAEFAPALYGALAANLPVDAAVAQARKAIYTAVSPVEWATPVLYLRAENARLFNVHENLARAAAAPRLRTLKVRFSHPARSRMLTATVGISATPKYMIEQLIKVNFLELSGVGSYHLVEDSTGRQLLDDVSLDQAGLSGDISLRVVSPTTPGRPRYGH